MAQCAGHVVEQCRKLHGPPTVNALPEVQPKVEGERHTFIQQQALDVALEQGTWGT